MPVTARLSRNFYDKLGEDIAQELVDWFNMVDFTYRHDLRELNELNFARFDAKLEQRVAELDAKVDTRVFELEAKLEKGLAELEAKMERGLTELGAKTDKRLAELDARVDTGFARMSGDLEKRIATVRTDIIKWMFVFWATNALIVFGLVTRFTPG